MPYYRPSTFLILLATVVFSLGLLTALFAYRTVEDLRHDAGMINHAGVIRGSIQRAAKQTLSAPLVSEQSAADVIDTVDTLIVRFLLAQQGYRHIGEEPQHDLVRNMHTISEEWQNLKNTFTKYRSTRSEELRREIVDKSERCWGLADAGVLATQRASENKLAGIGVFYFIIALGLLNTAIVVVVAYLHVRRRVEHHASYDAITSVKNRRSYDTEIDIEVSRSKRYHRTVSLILFDIDRFKAINDTYGHKTGDEVLSVIANLAGQHIRECDSLFRIGGDEFAVLVPEANAAQAYAVAEKIRTAVEQHSFAPAGRVTISVGVVELDGDMTPSSLDHHADHAMYQAKQNGRNTSRMQATADGRA